MKQTFLLSALLLVMATAFGFAPKKINGMVLDDLGIPISGASIIVKGSQTGTQSGRDGRFVIKVPDSHSVLIVMAVGYEQKEITVGKGLQLTIRLQKTSALLEDVVVTGYQAQRKRDITGSVSSMAQLGNISYKPLKSTQAGMLVGNLPGLEVLTDHKQFFQGKHFAQKEFEREGYDRITENPFLKVTDQPLSTFSIDVDAASYSNVRRFLTAGQMPPPGAVRIEEMINYFRYDYAQPVGKDPFAVHTEMAVCPWNTQHQLVLIGLQGKKIDVTALPPSNLTFLIDVSGSMFSPDKLPLVQASLQLLVDQLRPVDKVAMVTYAGNAGLVLPATSGDHSVAIKEAIENLKAGGSTAGGEGIQLAYKIARENFNREGNNRVILCTDGDFNVGASSDDALERMIEEERKSGVFLTVLGFGTGNYQDAKMQKLADKGNGNHAYIDQLSEAKKVLVNEFGGTLFTIAKDVKLQVEFNPKQIKGYRLIGYENRILAKEDFNNDTKDAGDLGSGHTVTALYELVPVGVNMPELGSVDSLRYQVVLPAITTGQAKLADEILTVKLRYKQPDGDKSSLLSYSIKGKPVPITKASDNLRFASSVASFGMLLRNSEFKGNSHFSFVRSMAAGSMGNDMEGYRKEFLQLVDKASAIIAKKEMALHNEKIEE